VSWVACLLEARAQYLAAGNLEQARAATGRFSGFYLRQGLYAELEQLHQELLQLKEHPRTLLWLGQSHLGRAQFGPAQSCYEKALELAGEADQVNTGRALYGPAMIDLREGSYAAAREKFEQVLTLRQQIGDQVGEAATLHELASIDLSEGSYAAARQKFGRSLAIKQQIGDRVGEAATWSQLGMVALRSGHGADGLRLLGLCYLIDREIGHGDTESDLQTVAANAQRLGYTPDQLAEILRETAASYAEDRGASLLRRVFENQDESE
jgi:tetratricopeptide (TPR) repeat protein